jgi:hypothetical protein
MRSRAIIGIDFPRKFELKTQMDRRFRAARKTARGGGGRYDGNLVDPASSHTLLSKIKPCMSKYKHLYRETANGSLYQL